VHSEGEDEGEDEANDEPLLSIVGISRYHKYL
jgi:hypothetical protein